MTKVCNKCKHRKSLDKFYKNCKAPDGYAWHCKDCTKKYNSARNITTEQQCNSNLKHHYGITLKDKEVLYIEQDGCCYICDLPVPLTRINVDHNHITGDIRGLLCWHCNTAIGKLKVDEVGTELLEKAIQYINRR